MKFPKIKNTLLYDEYRGNKPGNVKAGRFRWASETNGSDHTGIQVATAQPQAINFCDISLLPAPILPGNAGSDGYGVIPTTCHASVLTPL